jgi:hypothetical protein
MTPEQQRIAIAKSVGWTGIYYNPVHGGWMGTRPKEDRDSYYLLDYLNDLNAMHEAEKATFCNSMLWDIFVERLCDVTEAVNVSMIDALIITNRATAAQRAEAYLRTIGKWEGGSDE